MESLLQEISNCNICEPYLEFGCKPTLTAHPKSKIIIIGQAPGSIVHKSGVPWDDKSGDNLRKWMQIDKLNFYNSEKIALIPMGFCYPGKGKTGDLSPRKECAPLWHNSLFEKLDKVKLVLLVGQYAQNYYLQEKAKKTLTETVKNFEAFLPTYFVLPHPSPRNNIWQAKNSWFKETVLPQLADTIRDALK